MFVLEIVKNADKFRRFDLSYEKVSTRSKDIGMFDINKIKDVLKKYINNGTNRFAIYPFGVNGVNVRDILKDYFDIVPFCIVDNEYSRYNTKIINLDCFKKICQKDIFVVLTIEDIDANEKIYQELLTYVSPENIINLYTLISRENDNIRTFTYDWKRFLLTDFLPELSNINNNEHKKVKVRIAHSGATIWNAISTICQAFSNAPLFDVPLVISNPESGTIEIAVNHAKKCGYKYKMYNEYQVADDKPDIVILTNPYDKMAVGGSGCRRYARLVVVVYAFLIWNNCDSIEKFWEFQNNTFGKYNPDYYFL